MRYCSSCQVTVTGARMRCPLCQNLLTGDIAPETEVFPRLPAPRYSRQLLYKLISLAAIVSMVVCAAVNWMLPEHGAWAVFACVGILGAWVTTAVGISQRRNIIKNITWLLFLISALTILLDRMIGWLGWSLDYVLPCLCVASMASMIVLSLAMHIPPNEYLVNLVLASAYGVVPLIFVLTDVVRVIYPSVICVAVSVIIVAWLWIFEGKGIRRELKKKLHL